MHWTCLKMLNHENFDHNGEPYINHPIRVSERFTDPVLEQTALLHDVIEDTDTTLGDLIAEGVCPEVICKVKDMTKSKLESYKDYILRINRLNNPNHIFHSKVPLIKIADLEDNLSNLEKGSMRDKYELALAILKGEIYV